MAETLVEPGERNRPHTEGGPRVTQEKENLETSEVGSYHLWEGQGSSEAQGPRVRGCMWRAEGWGQGTVGLTLSSSSGRSPPSLMPRFMATKRSRPGLSLTLGLCRLVFSMITAKDST